MGDRPSVVLTARSRSDEIHWELQNDYATFSTGSRQITAEDTGHFIVSTEPAVAIHAVLWVIDEVRTAAE